MKSTIQARKEQVRHLQFLGDPDLWPTWPYLPLTRQNSEGHILYGLLYDLYGYKGRTGFAATVFLANLFRLPPSEEAFLALPREVFDTPEEIYAAGWRVD